MDNQSRYTEALKNFVQDHLHEDPALLLFKYQGKTDFDLKEAVQQISARQKAKAKLPSWAANPEIIFPQPVSVEQCSSEETAKFKAELVSGSTFLDLTTGFGIDAFYIGRNFKNVLCFELQTDLAAIVKANFQLLEPYKFDVRVGDGIEYLKNTSDRFDLIYVDPARRGSQNQKLYKLADCEPDVVSLWPLLTAKSHLILIKASPILDIKGVIQELPDIHKICVVAVKNEVKEILLLRKKNGLSNPPEITCVNLSDSKSFFFEFNFQQEEQAVVSFGEVGKYLIEPFSAILKAGAFKLFANRFDLKKLHPNSHLYTTSSFKDDIMGRVFEVISEIKADKKSIKSIFPTGKVNVITRNYSIKADELKRKFNLKDGGEDFLIGTKVGEKFRLFHVRRLEKNS